MSDLDPLKQAAADLVAQAAALPAGPEADAVRHVAGQLAKSLETFADQHALTVEEGLALSRGELRIRMASRGAVANALRSLQSTLRHLAYQAGAVADGDLSIEIYGLGPLGRAFNRMAEKLRESRAAIEAKNAELAERNRRLQEAYDVIDHELKIVADIQVSLLPAEVPAIPGFEVATHYRPARRAGGDYLDFFPLAGDRWGILVADVSGHGTPAAVVMSMTRVLFHTSVWARGTTGHAAPSADAEGPAAVLSAVNDALAENILTGQFVTCCGGLLDPAARTFTYASAGHPAPLLFDGAGARVCANEGGFPLGIMVGADYAVDTVRLTPGSVMVLYTDGLSEAFNDRREQFGEAGLLSALAANQADGPQAVRDAILSALDAHRGAVDLADDTTLVVLRTLPA